MRGALTICFCGLLFTAGCNFSVGGGRGPLVTGKAEGGTIWKNPTSAPSNEGSGILKGSRVDVYDRFIVVTGSDGQSQVVLDAYYSGLILKKD
jgi:hypothetical protein